MDLGLRKLILVKGKGGALGVHSWFLFSHQLISTYFLGEAHRPRRLLKEDNVSQKVRNRKE